MSGLARAVSLFAGSSLIGSITQVAKGKITAIFLGAAGVGVLSQLTTMWSLLAVFAGLGFYNGMTRHLAQHWRDEEQDEFRSHMSSSAVLLMGSSLIVAVTCVLLAPLLSDLLFGDDGRRALFVRLIALATPFFVMSQVYRAMLNSVREVSWLVRARIMADVASVGALGLFVWQFGLVGAILGFISLHAFFLVATLWAITRAIGGQFLWPDLTRVRVAEAWRNAPFGINGMAVVIIGLLPTLIISYKIITDLGPAENGLLAVALKVGTLYLGALSSAAGGYYFPTLAASKSEKEFNSCINETLKLYFYMIAPVAVVLMATGDYLMIILFSREFIPAAALLLLILPADLFRIASENIRLAMVVKHGLAISSALYLLWAIIYVALAFYWLPIYGITGVALAYLLSHALSALSMILAARSIIKFKLALSSVFVLFKSAVLVGLGSITVFYIDANWVGYLMCTAIIALWFVLNLRDRYFRNLVLAGFRKLKVLGR